MASTASSAHLPPLGAHEREEIGHQLQATLVELLDLSLVGKQLHWSVVGPLFGPLHLQLDELVNTWRDLADTVGQIWPTRSPSGFSQSVPGPMDRPPRSPRGRGSHPSSAARSRITP